jgi:creatinine amidohydrolase
MSDSGINKYGYYYGYMTWPEVEETVAEGAIALLPFGAVEAHGPHLPILTDTIISMEVAMRAAHKLSRDDRAAVVLPPISYVAAECANEFIGTISVPPESVKALVRGIAASVWEQHINTLVLVNNHFDPVHVQTLRELAEEITEPKVVFPDMTRKANAERLTEEFKSSSCHAGRYETSLVMAANDSLVLSGTIEDLEENHVSMVDAFKEGKTSFSDMGMDEAYCGDPAAATEEEGQSSYDILSDIVVEACS